MLQFCQTFNYALAYLRISGYTLAAAHPLLKFFSVFLIRCMRSWKTLIRLHGCLGRYEYFMSALIAFITVSVSVYSFLRDNFKNCNWSYTPITLAECGLQLELYTVYFNQEFTFIKNTDTAFKEVGLRVYYFIFSHLPMITRTA